MSDIFIPLFIFPCRYLVDHDPSLSAGLIVLIVVLQLLGYYIFRSSNSQKDAFRTNPDGPEVILFCVFYPEFVGTGAF